MDDQYLTIKYHDGTQVVYRSSDIEFFMPSTVERVKPDGKKYINQNVIEWARESDYNEIKEYQQGKFNRRVTHDRNESGKERIQRFERAECNR